jgi:translation initiation factor 1 (eIF-1/SUI1)
MRKLTSILLLALLVVSGTVIAQVKGKTPAGQDKSTKKAPAKPGVKKAPAKDVDLKTLAAQLKKAVQAGKLTEKEAAAKLNAAAGKGKPADKGKPAGKAPAKPGAKKAPAKDVDLKTLAAQLKKAVQAGKLTEKEAIAKLNAAAGKGKPADKGKPAGKAPAKPGAKKAPAKDVDLERLSIELKKAVAAGKLTKEQAIEKYNAAAGKAGAKGTDKKGPPPKKVSAPGADLETLFRLVEKGELTAEEALKKYKASFSPRKPAKKPTKKPAFRGSSRSVKELQELSKTLPTTSTAGDKEGPVSTFIFGWAANATHRFMDFSHTGKPRNVNGLSFRLDHRDHNAIGRTWENVTVRVAHGDFSSIEYNASRNYELVDEPVKVFDKSWSFPGLKGFPPLEPASWGGPQNSLSFRFDKPFEYNGKDAIYVEFKFSGGTAEDGREWKGELPYGFEYFLDSMPEVGGWRTALENSRTGGIYRGPARVAAVTSYTAGGQSVWTSSSKGLPFIRWDE